MWKPKNCHTPVYLKYSKWALNLSVWKCTICFQAIQFCKDTSSAAKFPFMDFTINFWCVFSLLFLKNCALSPRDSTMINTGIYLSIKRDCNWAQAWRGNGIKDEIKHLLQQCQSHIGTAKDIKVTSGQTGTGGRTKSVTSASLVPQIPAASLHQHHSGPLSRAFHERGRSTGHQRGRAPRTWDMWHHTSHLHSC